MTNQLLDAEGYPLGGPDAAFEGMAIDMMMKKEAELNKPVVEEKPVEAATKEPKKAVAKKATRNKRATKKSPAKKATPKPEAKLNVTPEVVEAMVTNIKEKTPNYATMEPVAPVASAPIPEVVVDFSRKNENEAPKTVILGTIFAGGKRAAVVKAERGFPSISIISIQAQWSSDVEALVKQAANVIEDGKVVGGYNPVTEGWEYIENLERLILGAPFSGGKIQHLTKAEFGG